MYNYNFTYILAQDNQQDSYQLDQGKSSQEAVSVTFSVDERVDDMFLKLFPAIGKYLKKSDCNFTLLRGACVSSDKLACKLPNEFIEKVHATNNLDELLAVLIASDYCNWINIRMLERMVVLSSQSEAKELIGKYKQIIFSKKLVDILEDLPHLEITGDYYTKVKDKWKKDFEDITIEDIANHWSKLQRIFDVDNVEILLQNLTKGSVEIIWLIPVELTSHARLSAFKNWCDLEDVSYLSIGDHVIKNDQLEFTEEHISITTGILT